MLSPEAPDALSLAALSAPPTLSTQHSALSTRDDYGAALGYLATFVDVERGGVPNSVFGLDRIRHILAGLGDPQRSYPSILIAGTNGKGSTAAMVEAGLRAAGYRTGLYTQPHLHTLRERVRLGGQPLSPRAFASSMANVRTAIEETVVPETPTTAYEVMTALALDAFAQARVDVAVLEVGLGGRLDATNVVDAAVSAITPISLDHTTILGDTIEAIATEKADIIKPGRPCVSATQSAAAMGVIRRTAGDRDAPLIVAEDTGAGWASASSPDLVTSQGAIPGVRLALAGSFQRANATVAATILDALHTSGLDRLDLGAVRAGLEQVAWPGRFEVIPGPPTVVIDGAHNVAAAAALRDALDAAYPSARRVFAVGIASDKDVVGILGALRGPRAEEPLIGTRAAHPRAARADAIAGAAHALGFETVVAPTVREAVARAQAAAGPEDVVVVAGSLYVVAEAREALGLASTAEEPLFDPWAAR